MGSWMRQLRVLVLLAAVAGCALNRIPTTNPAVVNDLATTQPSFWLGQPSAVAIRSASFTRLWDACEEVLRQIHLKIDRQDYRLGLLTSEPQDYRLGLLTSEPTVSSPFFELWRSDPADADGRVESAIAGIRRTVRFEFARNPDSSYTVTPKVLVERRASVEPKLRQVVDYDAVYWYPIARDPRMEKELAGRVEAMLR
jgi:hypothetical protein